MEAKRELEGGSRVSLSSYLLNEGSQVNIRRWTEGKNAYLSVNAITLEPDQEGLDLREWHENGWICYLDCKVNTEDNHFGRPSEGGMY